MQKPLQQLLLLLCVLLAGYTAQAQSRPFNADMVVALDGSGDFIKIQDAINAVPSNSERRTVIYIKRGLYNTEKLIVPGDKKNVTFIGESRDETIISYHIFDCATGKCPTADAAKWTGENIRTSATITLQGDGFRAENLTFQNTAGPVGQALALTVKSDKNIFLNCNFLGYQDTIYLWDAGKRSYFENCLVLGRTDYIYGAGIAWFEECEIRSWGGGWITAPSTPRSQPFGYVFNECRFTYATNSPRAGDDGAMVRIGRPWHEYPKVTIMNSYMTEKIHPEGWGDKWGMDYSDTSPDLHLYEYNNNGPGADMSGRANWAGLKALTAEEAATYTIQNVMGGSDNWDPTAQAPAVRTFNWTGSGATKGWLVAGNWNPGEVPAVGESATVDGQHEVLATGGSFLADLNLSNSAKLNVTDNSTATYISMSGAEITTAENVTLGGKIATKEANKLSGAGTLTLTAVLNGVHTFTKEGAGRVVLDANNSDFSGNWLVTAGTLEAKSANALGKGGVTVSIGATLAVGNGGAMQPTSALRVVTGASLVLNADVTLSEFYIDDVMQPLGEYTAATNAGLISGTGKVIVGRPSTFTFTGAVSGYWDVAGNYSPQLMPEAGETVIVSREIETAGPAAFPANMLVTSTGTVRLRGVHRATGTIRMEAGSRMSYATSGTGFTLDAPIEVLGDVRMEMSSGSATGSSMVLPGSISGSSKITARNTRNEAVVATLVLGGNNSNFTGTWDLTNAPTHASGVVRIEGTSANAFGGGLIDVGLNNKVLFSHEKSAGDVLRLNTSGSGKAVLNTNVQVNSFTLNGTEMAAGTYTATTHPAIFEGTGSLIVGGVTSIKKDIDNKLIDYADKTLTITGAKTLVSVYNVTGSVLVKESTAKTISFRNLKPGLYIVRYASDGTQGSAKVLLNK
ncbi:pectinesterase family protein [Botryobacter ruber]|uniref:pectinesterase family protein n=1 Tax=Botryobacter ruber TaxID=2171629 RepID=UPI0013E3B67C|nr:pectinesterase family protein [Botryobacter ruber]